MKTSSTLIAVIVGGSPLAGYGLSSWAEAVTASSASSVSVVPGQAERAITRDKQNEEKVVYEIVGSSIRKSTYWGREFTLTKYPVPNAPGSKFGAKSSGSLVVSDELGLLVQGDGSILKFSENSPNRGSLRLESVPSNIQDFLVPEVGLPNSLSVRGVTVGLGRVWISFTDDVSAPEERPCYGTSILSAELPRSLGQLEFNYFFRAKACSVGEATSPFKTGGALLFVDTLGPSLGSNVLLLGTGGDYLDPRAAQNADSGFGSIVALAAIRDNAEGSANPQVLAIGLRNPQSVVVSAGQICVTDHGPQGGDEINCFSPNPDSVANFGWPLSSYGKNYGGEVVPFAPTLPSHKEYGFSEPLYFWPESSVAPATISQDPWGNAGDLIVGTLGSSLEKGANSLNFFRPEIYGQSARLELHDRLLLGERIRSISVGFDENSLLVLDDSGAVWVVTE